MYLNKKSYLTKRLFFQISCNKIYFNIEFRKILNKNEVVKDYFFRQEKSLVS